jgi:DNA-binding transcriptional LysR family regulator
LTAAGPGNLSARGVGAILRRSDGSADGPAREHGDVREGGGARQLLGCGEGIGPLQVGRQQACGRAGGAARLRLVNRTTRRLALTEAGAGYRDLCIRILGEIEEAEEEAGRHGSEPRGRLKVNAPMSFGVLHVAPLLPAFLARHPGIEIDLTLNDRLVDLIEEGVDVAVRVGALHDSSLVARRLAAAEMICVASPAYLAAAGKPRGPADLARHNGLRYTYRRSPGIWTFQRDDMRQTVALAGNLSANNGDALRAAALAGAGIAVLPDFICGPDLVSGRLVRLLEGWALPTIPIHAVWPPQRHPSPKLRLFVDHLAARRSEARPWSTEAGEAA